MEQEELLEREEREVQEGHQARGVLLKNQLSNSMSTFTE